MLSGGAKTSKEDAGMKMTELLRYDIPPEVIRLWQTRESEHLLPVQELAIKRHNLFGNSNLLIQAPTSSGKTFVGEMAAIQTAGALEPKKQGSASVLSGPNTAQTLTFLLDP